MTLTIIATAILFLLVFHLYASLRRNRDALWDAVERSGMFLVERNDELREDIKHLEARLEEVEEHFEQEEELEPERRDSDDRVAETYERADRKRRAAEKGRDSGGPGWERVFYSGPTERSVGVGRHLHEGWEELTIRSHELEYGFGVAVRHTPNNLFVEPVPVGTCAIREPRV